MEQDSNSQIHAGAPRRGIQLAVNTVALVLAATGCVVAGIAYKNTCDQKTALENGYMTKTDLRKTYVTQSGLEEKLRAETAEKLLTEICKELDRYEKLVQKISDSQSKGDSYLAAAREARAKGDKTADVLYASALRYATEKMPILLDYVAWKKEGIMQTLDGGTMQSLVAAGENLSLLKVFCDSALEDASPQDLLRVDELLASLTAADARIAEAEAKLKEAQSLMMTQVMQSLSTASRQQLDYYAIKYEEGSVLSSLDEQRAGLLTAIQQWRACCTTSEESIMLPELADITDEILEKWLANFKTRMQTDAIGWEKRQEDWNVAGEVLELAEKKEGNIKTLLDELNVHVKQEMSRQWIEQANAAEDGYAIDELLSHANNLDAEIIKAAHRNLLCKAFDKRISRYVSERENITKKISDVEVCKSFLSGVSIQCWQLELEILDAQEKYKFNEFKDQLEKLRQLRQGCVAPAPAAATPELILESAPPLVSDIKAHFEDRLNQLRARLDTEVTKESVLSLKNYAEKDLQDVILKCTDPKLKRELEDLQNQARVLCNQWWNKVFPS